jgi:hypothetical protein
VPGGGLVVEWGATSGRPPRGPDVHVADAPEATQRVGAHGRGLWRVLTPTMRERGGGLGGVWDLDGLTAVREVAARRGGAPVGRCKTGRDVVVRSTVLARGDFAVHRTAPGGETDFRPAAVVTANDEMPSDGLCGARAV